MKLKDFCAICGVAVAIATCAMLFILPQAPSQ